MAELIREIVINASPATIFEFLTIPEKHVEWNGTSADLDPRPGGVYRVLAGGVHQAAGRICGSRAEREGGLHVRLGSA